MLNTKLATTLAVIGIIATGGITSTMVNKAYSWVDHLPEMERKRAELIAYACNKFEACDLKTVQSILTEKKN